MMPPIDYSKLTFFATHTHCRFIIWNGTKEIILIRLINLLLLVSVCTGLLILLYIVSHFTHPEPKRQHEYYSVSCHFFAADPQRICLCVPSIPVSLNWLPHTRQNFLSPSVSPIRSYIGHYPQAPAIVPPLTVWYVVCCIFSCRSQYYHTPECHWRGKIVEVLHVCDTSLSAHLRPPI